MMEEEIAQSSKKEIGKQSIETAVAAPVIVEEETLDNAEDVAAYSASKTLDEISEEVPQNIKDKIIDLEAEQQEKLRATMLKDTFQPKTSAIKNLQDLFADYPVVTNESLKLKMETIGQIPIDQESSVDPVTSLDSKQQVFSRLLTSINPFAQFVIREMVLNGQ